MDGDEMTTAGHAPEDDESVMTALEDVLDPGDHIVASCDGMVRESLHLFEKCKVAMSLQRIFVIRIGRGEARWHLSYPLSRCSIKKLKRRFDGSQLVVIGHGSGMTGLYFSRGNADRAERILSSIPMEDAGIVIETE